MSERRPLPRGEAQYEEPKKEVEFSFTERIENYTITRSELDDYLATHDLNTNEIFALAAHNHWSKLVMDLKIADHSLSEDFVEMMCVHNPQTPKLFDFLRTKIKSIHTYDEVTRIAVKGRMGRYRLLQDLHEEQGVLTFSRSFFEHLLDEMNANGEINANKSKDIVWYIEKGIDRGRFKDPILDEKFLVFLMDHGVTLDAWLPARVTTMTWETFKRVIASLSHPMWGMSTMSVKWMIARVFGKEQLINQQTDVKPLSVPDLPGWHDVVKLARQYGVTGLLLEDDRLGQVANVLTEDDTDQIVRERTDNFTHGSSQEQIDRLVEQCGSIPGFKLKPEQVKRFLDLKWDSKDTYPVDEKFLRDLLDKKNSEINVNIANKVSRMSWDTFSRLVEPVSTAHGNWHDIRSWMFTRLFNDRPRDQQDDLEDLDDVRLHAPALTVPDAPFDDELIGLMQRFESLSTLLYRNRLSKVSELAPERINALVREIGRNSEERARKLIDSALAQRDKLPGFKMTPEYLSVFLERGWQPAKLEDVDFLVDAYGKDLLKDAEDVLRPLIKKKSLPEFKFEGLRNIVGNVGHKRALFVEREENGAETRDWRVSPFELHALSGAGKIESVDFSSPDAAERTFALLIEVAAERGSDTDLEFWRDPALTASFDRFGRAFGFDKAFAFYGFRPDTTRHDVYHQIETILTAHALSGLSAEQFYGNILRPVSEDTTRYGGENSYGYLNAISRELAKYQDLATLLDKVRGISQAWDVLPELQELIRVYQEPKDIFSSWPRLRLFYERIDFIGRTELLEVLKEVKIQGEDKKYAFAMRLLTHKDSKVSVQALKDLLKNPRVYFDAADNHTPQEIQNAKKPSNYFQIPHLDLSAEELRDAYMNGDLSRLQALPPFSVEYKINVRAVAKAHDVRAELKRALGSREKNTPKAEARNPLELRKKIEELLKPLSLREFITGEHVLPPETLRAISKELYYSEQGLPPKPSDMLSVRARINKKGDPDAAIAGDDTASCDAFGTGKSVAYAANPGCAQFTLQIVRPDDSARTLAQSLITKDMNVGKRIDLLLHELGVPKARESEIERAERLAKPRKHIYEVLPPEAAAKKESYLSADNVEMNPNYLKADYRALASEVYRDFFRAYIEQFGDRLRLDRETVPIGQGHSDALTDLKKIDNTFAPRTPIGYSDKTHAEAYALRPQEPTLWHCAGRVESIPVVGVTREQVQISIPGVEYLTSDDALTVSYLESKIYADNVNLLTSWGNMENALIAKDINNMVKDRPNMSIKYVSKGNKENNETDKVTGYMLAYEGIHRARNERVIYVADLASEQDHSIRSRVVGARLAQGLIELYRKNYIEKGDLVPLYAEARETTSYQLLVNNLKKVGEDLGIDFVLEESDARLVGKDVMYPVTIRPVKKNV